MTARRASDVIGLAVITACREAGVKITPRPVIPSMPEGATAPEPESLAAVSAARDLEWAARRAVLRYVRNARADGRGWDRIAQVLRVEQDPDSGLSAAGAAHAHVASDLGSGPSFGWPCPSCLQSVIDHGPEAGHPAEAERGHATGCARLAETVRDWEAQWEGEDA